MKEYGKRIEAPLSVKQAAQEKFTCSAMMVWRALNYKLNSEAAKAIRNYVRENGGKLIVSFIVD